MCLRIRTVVFLIPEKLTSKKSKVHPSFMSEWDSNDFTNKKNQVKDDQKLLDLMMKDREFVQKIFQPTNFWLTLGKKFLPLNLIN